MAHEDEVSVLEAIAAIQRAAYEAAGIGCAELVDHLRARREMDRAFDEERPKYLPKVEDLQDESLAYLTRSFEDRAATATPTPFEDPMAYSWLVDTWRYHVSRLKYASEQLGSKPVVFATAPTGRFNAIAVPAYDGVGIVLESGLWQMARRLCIEIDPLLYRTEGPTGYRRDPDDVRAQCDQRADLVVSISNALVDYVIDGVTPPLVPTEDDFGSPVRMYESLFGGFIAFTIEHELHHHVAGLQSGGDPDAARAFTAIWRFLQREVWPKFANPPAEERVRSAYLRHHEEMRADTRGLNRLVVLGFEEGTASPTTAGGLLFFHAADTIRRIHLTLEDPDLLRTQEGMTHDALFLAALLSGESHPYPAVRCLAAVEASKKVGQANGELLSHENERLSLVFERINLRLASHPSIGSTGVRAHAKWRSDFRSLASF